jgi:hypothetical protein
MRKILLFVLLGTLLSGCELWNVAPQPFPVWTPIPTRTPGIITATPNIIIPTKTASPAVTDAFTPASGGPTGNPSLEPNATETQTPAPARAIAVEILGCNTGIDLTHGMGEVTNAYIVLKNTGTEDLPNACALLRAADEGREHPDKIKCVDNLPAGKQVTLKLTVDSTYQVGTVIQVDASSNSTLMLRVDKQSCTDIDVAGLGVPMDIGVIKPINP